MWPPIMCPRCWAMKFETASHAAQCLYCGLFMMKGAQVRSTLIKTGRRTP